MQEAASAELDSRSRSRPTRRRIVVLSLVGALVTVVSLAIFSWADLERVYYLRQLRHQPELLERWLRSGEEERSRSEALDRFLRERRGAETLFGLYLAEYDKRQFDESTIVDTLTRRREKGGPEDHGYLYLGEKNYGYVFLRGKRALGMYSTMNLAANVEMRRIILGAMDACVGQSFKVEELPGYEFHVEAIIDGEAKPPPWRSEPVRNLGKSAGHICYYRQTE